MKKHWLRIFYLLSFYMACLYLKAQPQVPELPETGIWDKFELELKNENEYADPFRDVELKIMLKSPEGKNIEFWGFYDGGTSWKVRFSPGEYGKWEYRAWFSDQPEKIRSGAFRCIPSNIPGMVHKDANNPFWMGFKGGQHQLFRSMHVGDRFFAVNWDDPGDPDDGNPRSTFLDWLQHQGYNMISVASHYLNRPEEGRGLGWKTPALWPLNIEEYRKMELILEELKNRRIIVFPFAGFFGARGAWPTNHQDQQLYIRYTLARIGFYWNTILNVAGPEPFWRQDYNQYMGAMKWPDINRLARIIKDLDVHGHLLTVHNEKRASHYGDPFLYQDWYDMSTLQGPTTLNRDDLYTGIAGNHHISKPVYAQETLWYGNKWHPSYSDDDLRKNALTILFAGGILNFADMNGNSSSGFSGELDFSQLHPDKHRIIHKAWDLFETIPFHKLTTRIELVRNGYTLAKEGEEYYTYLDTLGEVEIFVDYDYGFKTEWINVQDPAEVIEGPVIYERTKIESPLYGEDWLFHAWASKPEVIATGNFPDLAVDRHGNIHIVYNRNGLKYKKFNIADKQWTKEDIPGCKCDNVKRSDPDIVVDSQGFPVVFCGKEAARWNGEEWLKNDPGVLRDTELAIDSKDNVYLCHRKGNQGGFLGMKMLPRNENQWLELPDPDLGHSGPNDHVYGDLWIDDRDVLHLVQRHGPVVEVTYRRSDDGGLAWPVAMDISNERSEAPHIITDRNHRIYVTTGKGYVFAVDEGNIDSLGRKLNVYGRMQPEFGADEQGNVYMTAFGGHYNIKNPDGFWLGPDRLDPVTSSGKIGFVETTGSEDFAYIIWEEGEGNPDEGLEESSDIVVGRLFPDGRIIGLKDF